MLSLFIIFACFPVYWMFLTTFKQVNDLYNLQNNPLLFQLAPTLDQVQYLFERTNFSTWVLNTGEVGLAVVVITVVICVPAAYVLARSQFPGSGSLGMGIFLTYLVPPTLLFLPLSQLVVGFGLVNDKWSLALVYPTFTIPFCTWLLMGFFKNVPREITEAARVDGCSRLGAMFRIVLPLSVPGILTICIFAFTLAMQEYVYALTFVSSSWRRLLLGLADGRCADRLDPRGHRLQPLHGHVRPRDHRRRIEVGLAKRTAERPGFWPGLLFSPPASRVRSLGSTPETS